MGALFFGFAAIDLVREFDQFGFGGLKGPSQASIFCAKAQYFLNGGVIGPL